MIKRSEAGGAVWIDLTDPTASEVSELGTAYHIESSMLEKLTSPTLRHTVEFGRDHAYLVLHFPAFDEALSDAAFEIDFVIGREYVITAHYGPNHILDNFKASGGRDEIFFGILGALIADFDDKLAAVDHSVREMEKNMFAGKEKQTIMELSETSRHLIDFKKITAVYPDSFKELAAKGRELFGDSFNEKVIDILDNFYKVHEKLNLLNEAVHELRETNTSILSTKQNETMKTLTGVTVIATIIFGVVLIWLGYLALK